MKANMKLIPAILVLIGLAAAPAALAQACCAGQAGSHAGCDMAGQTTSAGHDGHSLMAALVPVQASTSRPVFKQSVQSVFDDYIKIQNTLAQDSLQGVAAKATAVAKTIRGDSTKALPLKVAEQSEALAQAKDLKSARAAFKPLSESLIGYFKAQKTPAGSYYEAYCPMVNSSWLQTNKTIMNPYMGKGMLHCGEIKE